MGNFLTKWGPAGFLRILTLNCYDSGFESCWGDGCLPLVLCRQQPLCLAGHLFRGAVAGVCLIVCIIGTSTLRQLRLHLGCLTTERCERYFVLVLWTIYLKGKIGKFSVGYNTSTHYPRLHTSTHDNMYWNTAVTSNQTRNVCNFFLVSVDSSLFLRSCQWQVILIHVRDYLNTAAICRMRMQDTYTIHW